MKSVKQVCLLANFSCNNAHQFDLVDTLSSHFDYNLHSEKDAREKFLTIGANPLWWPMASNPKYFKPLDLPRNIEVSFVGANYALRARYVVHLLLNDVAVHAYGPGWQWGTTTRWRSLAKRFKYLLMACTAISAQSQYRASANLADHDLRCNLATRFPENVHSTVSDEELIALYSQSQISLGFLEVYDRMMPAGQLHNTCICANLKPQCVVHYTVLAILMSWLRCLSRTEKYLFTTINTKC